MKAINIPLRVETQAISGGARALRSRAAIKKIARKRLRAAEREFFRRELAELHAAALVEQTAHAKIATRQLERLHLGASAAVRALLDLAQTAADDRLAAAPDRIPFYVRQPCATGEQPVLLAVASCAETRQPSTRGW